MTAVRNAQSEPTFARPNTAAWQKQRMELLKPQQQVRTVRRRHEAVSYLLLALVIFSAAFAYVFLNGQIHVAAREVTRLEAQIAEIENNSKRTELAIGELGSLAQVEEYATSHLGMVYPELTSIQYLDQQVSYQIATDLAALAPAETIQPEEAAAEQAPVPEEQEASPVFAAWAELFGQYFAGTALAVQD